MEKGIYVHLDVETMGPVPGEHCLFQVAMFAHWDKMIPDYKKPFNPSDPCFVAEINVAMKVDKSKVHPKTVEFWNQHQRTKTQILENALDSQEVAQKISDFFRVLESRGVIQGIVMSPSWFDWSHFVHFYQLFSRVITNCFDLSKINVICLKTMTKMSKLCGIPWFYHPTLKHTHNAIDDVREAAWRFIWILRSFQSIGTLYPNMPIIIENRLRQAPSKLRWRRPPRVYSNQNQVNEKISKTVVSNFIEKLSNDQFL